MDRRSQFFWQVRQRIAEWKRGGAIFSVVLVRMNEYGHIVATQGRSAANPALRATRQFLTGTLRDMDLIGHFGCACYALLLPHTALREAMIVAERIRKGCTQCIVPTKDGALEPTVSIGIAEVSEGDDAASLIQRSEAAMLAAGKNRAFCHNGQWSEAVEAAPPREGSGEAVVAATLNPLDMVSIP